MKVKFSLIFNRKNHLNSDGKAPIWIRARYQGRYKYITTSIAVAINHWDKSNQMITIKHPNYQVLNVRLEKKLQFFEDLQTKCMLQDKKFDLQTLDQVVERGENSSFIKFMESELASERVNSTKTKMHHSNSINKFRTYAGDISFHNLNYSVLKGYENHLRDLGLKPNTVNKLFKNLKIYATKAEKRELLNPKSNPFRDFKVYTEQTERVFLTIDEVKKLEDLKFDDEEQSLEYTRDLFLFGCYTSLRISDLSRISSKCLFSIDGRWIINELVMKKGSPGSKKILYIPLNQLYANPKGLSKPELLIKKYYKKDDDCFFGKLSEPHINRNLKDLAEKAKIEKRLSFHISRHTFATLTLNHFNVSIDIVRRIMGHSKLETTQIYLHSNSKVIHQALQYADWGRISTLGQDAVVY